MGSAMPRHNGADSQRFQIFVVLLYLDHTLYCRTTFGKVTQMGKGVFLASATPPISRRRSASALQFWGSPLFMFILFDVKRSNSA